MERIRVGNCGMTWATVYSNAVLTAMMFICDDMISVDKNRGWVSWLSPNGTFVVKLVITVDSIIRHENCNLTVFEISASKISFTISGSDSLIFANSLALLSNNLSPTYEWNMNERRLVIYDACFDESRRGLTSLNAVIHWSWCESLTCILKL